MRHSILALLLSTATAAPLLAAPAPVTAPAQIPATVDMQDAALAKFFADYDAAELARSPLAKSYRGIVDADYGKWDDFSDAAEAEDLKADQAALAEIRRRFDPAKLSPDSLLSYRLFEKKVARSADSYRYRDYGYVFDQMNGAQSQLPAFLINIHRVTSTADAQAYISRLQGMGPGLRQAIAQSKARADKGIMPPKWVYPYVINDAKNVVAGFPFTKTNVEAPLYADIKGKIEKLGLTDANKAALLQQATDALLTSVKPAYAELVAEMERQQAMAGTDDGVWRFKDGAGYYAQLLKNYTTTDLNADQIHTLGLAQVARIHGEMREIMAKTGFQGSLQAFFDFIRTDKRFYAPNTEEGRALYLSETEKAKQQVTALLPQYFGILPKAPLVVKPVEPFREKSAGKAFYQGPSPDGSRPGTYYANLYNMADMPLVEVDALFYHEGLPGHHLQRTIQTELTNVPPFRRFGGFTAYTEGWGLYSEKLAKDMGLYPDPYRDFGRLQLELHRAIRLVVDSGLHHKKWTREQAIQYVKDNSADAPGGIVKAIERYVVYPGQATAYMVGRLKISELRDQAQRELGPKFGYPAFHDVVLKDGAVPLDMLEEQVKAWIAKTK